MIQCTGKPSKMMDGSKDLPGSMVAIKIFFSSTQKLGIAKLHT